MIPGEVSMKEAKTHSGLVVARPGLVREGLQALLSAIPGMGTLQPADDGPSALDRLAGHRPNLVIVHASLPEDELRSTLRQIQARHPDVLCIVVASTPQQGRALEATGADAILIEGACAALLSRTIKRLLA
jgi:DNA-binding NarL/FixJ family response regulator